MLNGVSVTVSSQGSKGHILVVFSMVMSCASKGKDWPNQAHYLHIKACRGTDKARANNVRTGHKNKEGTP
jgi:hypothetical protein